MYCTHCGTKLNEGAKFCVNCGKATSGTTEPKVAPAPVAVAQAGGSWHIGKLFQGRLDRMRYWLGSLATMLPFFLVVAVWGFVNILCEAGDGCYSTGADIVNNVVVPILFAVCFIFFIVGHFSVAFRRCHDFGQSGWISLCSWIPYIGWILALFILFNPGNKEANKYGNPPTKERKFWDDIFNR